MGEYQDYPEVLEYAQVTRVGPAQRFPAAQDYEETHHTQQRQQAHPQDDGEARHLGVPREPEQHTQGSVRQQVDREVTLEVMCPDLARIFYFGAGPSVRGKKIEANVSDKYQADGKHQPVVHPGSAVHEGQLVGNQHTAEQRQRQDDGIPAEAKS